MSPLSSFNLASPLLAQAAPKTTPARAKTTTEKPSVPAQPEGPSLWMYTSAGLGLALVLLGVTSALQYQKLTKKLRFEKVKNTELHKRIEMAAVTISKMEKNPDLIHSRDFNLDYLRMRMAEEKFRFAIVNQSKIKIKQQISMALRPTQAQDGDLGIPSTGRQIDQIFDVEYEPADMPKGTKRVLFRIEIKMVKLPTQPTSQTIAQIIDCIESFLSPGQENDSWQPTIQGRLANMRWDQNAKPTPRLVLEQTQEGSNVTFRTSRMAKA